MTREERLNYYKTIEGLRWGMSLPNVINSIYDDFESRICENCKHRKEMIYCNVLWTDVGEVEHLWVDKNFGCSKFERKDK